MKEGINHIRIIASDTRPFISFMKLVKRIDKNEILNMMAHEETVEMAKERVIMTFKSNE